MILGPVIAERISPPRIASRGCKVDHKRRFVGKRHRQPSAGFPRAIQALLDEGVSQIRILYFSCLPGGQVPGVSTFSISSQNLPCRLTRRVKAGIRCAASQVLPKSAPRSARISSCAAPAMANRYLYIAAS